MSHPLPGTGGRSRSRRVGDVLARLGGADLALLQQAPADRVRAKFVGMGLVVLSTAGIAALSMVFALVDGLHVDPVLAVSAGLVWGFIIANLDRMLILNLVARGGLRQIMVMVLPRVVIAAVLGIVISTPLVLRVFHSEIQAQIVTSNTKANEGFGNDVKATGSAQQLAQIKVQIAKDEAIQRGEMDAVVTPEVQARQQYLDQAKTTLTQRRQQSDQLYAQWQCELDGASCAGSSDRQGDGPLARALKSQYDVAIGETNAAAQDVSTAENALNKARDAASGNDATALETAQAVANKELPGLRDRAAALQGTVDENLDQGTQLIQDNDGILARIVALDALGSGSFEARTTHITVALLFFMIEMMPVLVKILSSMGPTSVYDKVRDKDDDQLVAAATAVQRREAAERGKVESIESDMRTREESLGIRANAHVEKEMIRIIDAALAQWSTQVNQTLRSGAQPAGGPQANGVPSPHPAAAPPTQAATPRVILSKFNLANGSKL